MSKPQINTRVEKDVAQQIEAFAEENDISKADAARRFLLTGMGQLGELPDSAPDTGGGGGWLETVASRFTMNTATVCLFATVFSWLAAASLLGSGGLLLPVLAWSVGFAFLVVGALLTFAAALASVAINQPLRGLLPLVAGESTEAGGGE